MVLILYNIRSAQNVGSLFRTADAASVTHIYLAGYTPAPVDRFGRKRKDITKVSLGAEAFVPWTMGKTIVSLVKKLKKENYCIVALEQSNQSMDYKKYKAKGNTALIVGNEVSGLDEKVLVLADIIIEIPMGGKKESLNVSVAAGIALFRIQNI